jgi:2-enoate reductase
MLEGAMAFRDVIDVPVMTPSLHNPDNAATAIEEGKTDIVGLSRPVIADPEWANKVQNGEADKIRKCVRCNHCIFCLFNSRAIRCTVNRQNGLERFNLRELLKL